MDPVYRTLTVRGATGKLRAARLQDKDYLVVPVTALVEAVIHPLGSKGRGEFVPRKVLQRSTETWNGRPCVPDHPMDATGQLVSANLPVVYEQQAFGMTFNAAFRNDRELHMEAWLDPKRAEVVGQHAVDVINKVRAEQAVEVSVGGFVQFVEKTGTYDGQEYGVEWLQITSDHLAIGLSGARGACSIEMGCGAMRANTTDPHATAPIYVLTPGASGARLVAMGWQDLPRVPAGHPDGGQWLANDNAMDPQQVASLSQFDQWRAKVKALLKSFDFRANMRPEDMSDDDLREMLQTALTANFTGYRQLVRVYPERKLAVFVQEAEPQGTGDIRWYRQGYTLSKDGKVALEGDPERVRMVQSFEAMGAEPPEPEPEPEKANDNPPPADPPVEPKGACGCQDKQELQMHRNADKIKALIEDPKTPFTAEDQAFLEGLTDERLAGFSQQPPAPTPPAPPTPPPTPPTPPTPPSPPTPKGLTLAEVAEAVKQLGDDEFLKLLPEDARAHVVQGRQLAKERRERMLSGLKAATKDVYSDAELAGMSNEQLTKLAKAVGFDPEKAAEPEPEPEPEARGARVIDWSGMGGARQLPQGTQLKDFTPPDPWADALKARKGA